MIWVRIKDNRMTIMRSRSSHNVAVKYYDDDDASVSENSEK